MSAKWWSMENLGVPLQGNLTFGQTEQYVYSTFNQGWHLPMPPPSSVLWLEGRRSLPPSQPIHGLCQDVWHGHVCPFYEVVGPALMWMPSPPLKITGTTVYQQVSVVGVDKLMINRQENVSPLFHPSHPISYKGHIITAKHTTESTSSTIVSTEYTHTDNVTWHGKAMVTPTVSCDDTYKRRHDTHLSWQSSLSWVVTSLRGSRTQQNRHSDGSSEIAFSTARLRMHAVLLISHRQFGQVALSSLSRASASRCDRQLAHIRWPLAHWRKHSNITWLNIILYCKLGKAQG